MRQTACWSASYLLFADERRWFSFPVILSIKFFPLVIYPLHDIFCFQLIHSSPCLKPFTLEPIKENITEGIQWEKKLKKTNKQRQLKQQTSTFGEKAFLRGKVEHLRISFLVPRILQAWQKCLPVKSIKKAPKMKIGTAVIEEWMNQPRPQ